MKMSISNLYTFNVSTKNRQAGSSDTDNFFYQFDLRDSDKFTHISVTNVNLPKSWYVVRDPLNMFQLQENGSIVTITFPEGNYDQFDLFTMFQTLLNNNSPNGYHYTVLEVNTTSIGQNPVPDILKIQVSNNAPPLTTINFIFDNISSIDLLLGYIEGINPQVAGGTTIAPNVYNLNFESAVYLISDAVESDYSDTNFSNATLATINVADVLYGSYATQDYDILTNRKKFSNKGKIFNFQLTTDNGLSSFFLNFVDLEFTLNFFTYTPNINYYGKSIQLQEIVALNTA